MFYNLQLVRCTKGRPASITLESACDEGGSGRAIPQAPWPHDALASPSRTGARPGGRQCQWRVLLPPGGPRQTHRPTPTPTIPTAFSSRSRKPLVGPSTRGCEGQGPPRPSEMGNAIRADKASQPQSFRGHWKQERRRGQL